MCYNALGDGMDRNNIEKIARSPEDRLLLAKLWDKINAGIRKNIPANTCFLSPRELEMARFLFGEPEGLYAFGGYADAERRMLVYLPEYLEENALYEEDSPCVCLRAEFYQGDTLDTAMSIRLSCTGLSPSVAGFPKTVPLDFLNQLCGPNP